MLPEVITVKISHSSTCTPYACMSHSAQGSQHRCDELSIRLEEDVSQTQITVVLCIPVLCSFSSFFLGFSIHPAIHTSDIPPSHP